ncbi:GGDEF domain-containing protein [Aliamphritea spongicola]|uniref:GGDEF domain-containing protein n=1 Tax=Aliamphritea spongicola TaxID=707589 RepID=UPI00196AFCD2|nr:diguanylate cyclase [Aliamphritea spongicola]MBN3563722.1 diguanylate cyclase [Aliamphritea spongicola]
MNSLQSRIIFSILLAILGLALLFLFVQDKTSSERHQQAEINQYISKLEQLDAKLEKQILLMDSWYFRSYDELNSVYTDYKETLASPPSLPDTLAPCIPELQASLEEKFPLIEQLKSNNALLRNSLNYLPNLIEVMFNRLETAKQQRQITAETSILFRNYLQNEVIQSLTNQLVDYRLETHQVMPYSGLLPEELQPLWENMLKHLSLLNMHRDNNIKLSQQLESIAMQSKIEDFNKLFSEHLAFLDEHREQQQTWLGIYVLAGLLLISVLIYALRHYHEQHYFHKTESMTDTLTGLGNRRLLEQQLPVLFNEAKRNHTSLGILFIDLDGFKAVNDTLGHQQGDELLRHIANELQLSLRENDLVIRFGGDEFVLAIANANKDILERIAKNTLRLCSTTLEQNIRVSASIGISHYPSNTRNMHELVELADQAMYQAKQEGKQCIRFYTPE